MAGKNRAVSCAYHVDSQVINEFTAEARVESIRYGAMSGAFFVTEVVDA